MSKMDHRNYLNIVCPQLKQSQSKRNGVTLHAPYPQKTPQTRVNQASKQRILPLFLDEMEQM